MGGEKTGNVGRKFVKDLTKIAEEFKLKKIPEGNFQEVKKLSQKVQMLLDQHEKTLFIIINKLNSVSFR